MLVGSVFFFCVCAFQVCPCPVHVSFHVVTRSVCFCESCVCVCVPSYCVVLRTSYVEFSDPCSSTVLSEGRLWGDRLPSDGRNAAVALSVYLRHPFLLCVHIVRSVRVQASLNLDPCLSFSRWFSNGDTSNNVGGPLCVAHSLGVCGKRKMPSKEILMAFSKYEINIPFFNRHDYPHDYWGLFA